MRPVPAPFPPRHVRALPRPRVGSIALGMAPALLGLVAACQPAIAPAITPSSSAAAAGWARVDPNGIEQPEGFMTVERDPSGSLHPTCAPCHPAVDTTMSGVASGPAGLVAVGWIFEGFHGATWHSTDGPTWALGQAMPENTELAAVAANAHLYVAVGLNGKTATAWASTDGSTWTQATESEAFAAEPLRLTSVTAWSGGFAAAGYEGYEFGTARAAFWISPDGLTWRRAPDSPELADSRAWSITGGGPGLVAVGTPGPSDRPGPAAVWTSSDGLTWRRAPSDPVFTGARMRTVTSAPRIGLVAAGEDLAGDTGAVWVSADGQTWKRAPSGPDLGRAGIQVRMYAAIGGGPGVVVAGTADEGVQYGEAVIWTSPDGLAWTRQPATAEFADAELTALALSGTKLIAVGDRGAPDTYIASVWTSPDGWGR